MIPALREFFIRLFFDKGAFLLWTRAALMALANGGMMYSPKVAAITGLQPDTVEFIAAGLSGFAILLPAGDKTPPEVKALAAKDATP